LSQRLPNAKHLQQLVVIRRDTAIVPILNVFYPELHMKLRRTFLRSFLVVMATVAIAFLLVVRFRVEANAQLSAAFPTQKLKVGSMEREYVLYVPQELPSKQAVPLVFVLHGGSGTAAGMIGLSGFNQVADREKCLVVYPQGIGKGWNDGRITTVSQAHRDKIDELAFFDELLKHLSSQHPIDPKRVYVTGISNGGIMTHTLAANRSEKIAAIATVVGGIAEPVNEQFQPDHPVSVLIIQGSDDRLVPYQGGKISGGDGKDRGSVIATEQTVKLWVKANGCKDKSKKEMLADRDPKDACRTEASIWTEGRDGSEVWLYRIQGGGHTWPDGPAYLPKFLVGKVTHDFGSEAIWDFFQKHPKP
jgi:polyhydroxybutyrate depolymerase